MLFKQYVSIVSVLFLFGCAGSKKIVTETRTNVETLTEITEKKLDTSIFIPAEKVSLFIATKDVTIKKDEKPKVFLQQNGRVSTQVIIDSLGITVTSKCDSIEAKLRFYEKTFKEFRKEVVDVKSKVTEKQGYSQLQLIFYMLATAIVSFAAAYLLKTLKII